MEECDINCSLAATKIGLHKKRTFSIIKLVVLINYYLRNKDSVLGTKELTSFPEAVEWCNYNARLQVVENLQSTTEHVHLWSGPYITPSTLFHPYYLYTFYTQQAVGQVVNPVGNLTVLSLFNPALNLTLSLLSITPSHLHASASDSTFDFWRYINI